MLTPCTRIRAPQRRASAGFSLIEAMVALVIGLIVAAAAVALIVAINQANAATVQSARLTQELRSIVAVIASDLKRARRVDDSIGSIGQATNASSPYDAMTPAVGPTGATCISFGYDGDVSVETNKATKNFRSYRLATTNGVGSVVLASSTNPASATCTSAGTTLTSNAVDITQLMFTRNTASEVTILVEGRLRFRQFADEKQTVDSGTPKRIVTQAVYIRSNSVH